MKWFYIDKTLGQLEKGKGVSRSTQYIGHANETLNFIMGCKKLSIIGKVTGMFGEDVCDLYEYQDPDGDIWEEFEQYSPWSSGPMIFLGLKRKKDGMIKGWKWIEEHKTEFIDYNKGVFYV